MCSTRKKAHLALLRCWHLPGEAPWEQSCEGAAASEQEILPQLDYLDSLWEQLCRLRDSRWIERAYAPAAALTGSASGGHGALLANFKPHAAFEHQLADAQTHNLPALPLPAHTPDAVYPPPLVVFRLFDFPDVPENMSLPPSSSIERFMLEEHLRAVIAENSSDRKLTAAAMSDLPVKNKALALSYVQIELVFSELLRLPKPAQSELFYCVLLIELCKLQPNAMPQVLAQATEMLYDRLDRMQLECRDRLVRWFSYHLSNFQFLWTWGDWIDTLPPLPSGSADPATHPVLDQPKASFIRHVLLQCMRFSYHQRLVDMLPKGCEALLPANPVPFCKYDDEAGASLASRAAALAFRSAVVEAHALPEEAFKVIHDSLPNGLTLREMEELCVDVFFTIIFNIGSKTFSHMSSALEKYKSLAKSMLQKKLNMQEQILRIMHQVFKPNHQMQEYLVRKMLNMELIDYPAIINWALSQEMIPFLT